MAKSVEMNIFCKNVQRCLDARGWSKQHLADLIGVHRAEISRIVSGKRNFTILTAEAIANALEVPLSELLSSKFKISELAA